MDSRLTLSKLWMVLISIAALVLLSSCEQDPTAPVGGGDKLTLDPGTESGTQASWRMLNVVQTQEQFSAIVAGGEGFISDEMGMVNNIADVRRETDRARGVFSRAARSQSFSKVATDSLIWSEEWNDPISGTAGRRALYYDSATGIGRIYEVIFQFPSTLKLQYDSTEVQVHLGPSLADSTDDRFLSIEKLTEFEAGYYVERIAGSGEATDWDVNNEITGAILTNVVNYGSQIQLRMLTQNVEFNPDNSGTISERLDYRDNTALQRTINFYDNYTGDFSETWRNGITVTGTFDALEDDNHAAVTRTITFPNHPLVASVSHAAEYTLNPQDSSSEGSWQERINFRNGGLDTSHVDVSRAFNGSNWQEDYTVRTSREGQSDFVVTYFDNYKTVDGEFIAPDEYFTLFTFTIYSDGSGEGDIEVYTNKQAYLNGEPPIMTAHIVFGNDGSGEGVITESDKSYRVTFGGDGEIEVADDEGNSLSLSGY